MGIKSSLFALIGLFIMFLVCTKEGPEGPVGPKGDSDTVYVLSDDSTAYSPTADFIFSPDTGYTSTIFQFNASNSSDSLAFLIYRWKYEPESTWTVWSQSSAVSHQFGSIGSKNVMLEVRNLMGKTDSLSKVVVVLPRSVIGVSTASLSPACSLGANAETESFEVWNSGNGTLNYTINDDAVWLSCSPSNGSSSGEHDSISIDYSTSGLLSGTHTAVITITGAWATNTPQTISVSLTILKRDLICGDTLVDDRDGQKYATVHIGSQCWMAENLNVGIYKASTNTGSSHSNVSNNGNIEKYAYDNDTTNFATYGGLYDWDEAMDYSTTEGAHGICPYGWHIPSDAEWKTLEINLGMSSTEANITGWRGTDQGSQLKDGGTSGFKALLSGYRLNTGAFFGISSTAYFWSSSQYEATSAWYRNLHSDYSRINYSSYNKAGGLCIRCIKD